jgi:hypothetical protein
VLLLFIEVDEKNGEVVEAESDSAVRHPEFY